jgi:polar amino acid transport system substrate-binding protein
MARAKASRLLAHSPPSQAAHLPPLRIVRLEVYSMIRHALAAALILIGSPALAQELKTVEAGKLTWGSSPTFKPFEFMRDGQPQGFDVDLMDNLAKRLSLTSSMMGMDFKGVIPALLGNRIDAGVSGLYVTAERAQVADFIPYVLVGNQIVVRKGNPKKISGRDGMCGFKVAVPVNTAFEASTKAVSAECKAKGQPEIDILSLTGSDTVALALQQGRVDAALNSTATVAAMIGETPDAYELAGPPFDANTKVGIALRKDDAALKTRLDAALKDMVKDGTFAALLKKWNLPPQASIF